MTLAKDKKLQTVEHALPTLPVNSITPNKSTSGVPLSGHRIPVLDPHHIATFSDLLKFSRSSQCRVSAEEEEKKRISRELHDGLGQILTSMNLQIQQCLNGIEENPRQNSMDEEQKASLHALSTMVKQAMNEVRAICSSIRPAILDDLGVIAAITWQCRQVSQVGGNLEVISEVGIDETEIPEGLKTVIYRIVQESLNNALKYSQAKQVKVSLWNTNNTIKLAIEDDGVGFDPAEIKEMLGMGLMSMRERAESANGFLKVNAGVDQGVSISASFPLKRIILNG